MKSCLAIIVTIIGHCCFAQCPFVATLKNNGSLCLGHDTLVISTANRLYQIAWYTGNKLDTTVTAMVKPIINGITVAGGNGKGAAANQLYSPNSIFIDSSGNLYVADLFNYRIQKFPFGSTSATNGQTVAGGNGIGKAANQFQPSSVFVNGSGYIYVADNINGRILKFPPNSTSATNGIVVAGGNGQGAAPDQFSNPISLFVDVEDNLYVVDALNARIQKFMPGTSNGVTVAGGNGYGAAANQFNGPAGIYVDASKNIYVDDAANNRIQIFAAGATNGITVAGGNGFGAAANQLKTPTGVWVDGNGNIFVADVNNQRIQKFPAGSNSNTNGQTVAGGNGLGMAANQFSGPVSIFIGGNDNIYVADVGNNRVQEFSQTPIIVSSIDTVYIPKTPGTYTAVVTDSAGCTVTTNAITIYATVTPTISISASNNSTSACAQTDTLTFMATTTNGGTTPSYQWQINGTNVGANSATFTAVFTSRAVVACILTSNAVCAATNKSTSNYYNVLFGVPPVASLISKPNICFGFDTLIIIADANNNISKIAWYNGSLLDNTVTTAATVGIDTTKIPATSGSYTAIVTNNFGCSVVTNTINIVSKSKPSIIISSDKQTVCAGNTMVFTAKTSNTSANPLYKWQVNGNDVGINSTAFSNATLANGDAVTCIVSNGIGCTEMDTSNSIIASIKPLPMLGAVGDIFIMLGQSTILNIPVRGNIASYLWSPVTNLSSNIVLKPMATPLETTVYTLKVTSVDSCTANGTITVKVSFSIHIPSGFTPNGDGLNDMFYVLGGMDGDLVKDFSIFDRWGKRLFQVQNVLPNNRSFGWNGTYNGALQSEGSYIYVAKVVSANGTEQVYKGTVVLMR